MRRFILNLKLSLASLLVAGSFGLATAQAAAMPMGGVASVQSSKDAICQGVNLTGQTCGSGSTTLSDVLKVVINILSAIVGIAAVIMIIIAGMRFITSAGDSSKVSGAKSTLTYAIVGLIIVAIAQVIVHFVITNV